MIKFVISHKSREITVAAPKGALVILIRDSGCKSYAEVTRENTKWWRWALYVVRYCWRYRRG